MIVPGESGIIVVVMTSEPVGEQRAPNTDTAFDLHHTHPQEHAMPVTTRWSTQQLHQHRQIQFARAILVGLGAGLLGVLFQLALASAEHARIGLLHWAHGHAGWGWLVLPVLGGICAGIAGWLTTRFAPEASGSGIPHVKGVLLHVRTLDWARLLPVKFVGGVLAIGAGLSLGREGPTVQMGAAVGKAVGQWLHLPRRSRSQLVAAGAGAGLAAAFNAPLAGFIFTIEELQRELSPLTYGTALIAAVVADVVTRTLLGQSPSFHVTSHATPALTALPFFAVLGILAGVVGMAFNRCLLWTLRQFHAWTSVPRWAHPLCVAVLAGLIGWWLPQALGGGHATAEAVMNGQYTPLAMLGFVLLLFVAKFVLTIVSYGTGVPGGIFAPLLVLGALLGIMNGQLGGLAFPGMVQSPEMFAVVGMAAAFAAIVRAPLTGIVLILEMTANYALLFPLLVACLLAFVVAERLHNRPIYEALLEYDLERSGTVTPSADESLTLQLMVEPQSAMDGCRVHALALPAGCLLILVKRGSREIIPAGNTRLRAGDQLSVVVAGDASQACLHLQALARA